MTAKEVTHTPGPWVMVPHHSNGIYGKTFSIGPKSTEPNGGEQLKRFVATASSSQHSVTSEETEANARLISAAPEMLEALIEARGFIGASERTPRAMEVYVQLLDVIWKAIGKEEGQ